MSQSEAASGCGADALATLSFMEGWAAVALSVVAVVVAVGAVRRSRWAPLTAMVVCLGLLSVSFPLHLPFEILGGLAGEPTDWRAIGNRLVLFVAALLFAGAVARRGSSRSGPPRARPLPAWGRRTAYAAAAVPVLGWTVPHLIWVAGVPLGISHQTLDEARQLSLPMQMLISLAPVAGALLTVGLARNWGQVFPAWLPGIGGRRVPRTVAVLPAGVVSAALTAYGIWGIVVIARELILGAVGPADLIRPWAVTATVLVFVVWGLALAAATVAYARATGQESAVS